MAINKFIFTGRLTKDPELKTSNSGLNITKFSVAVDRRGSKQDKQTDFFDCSCFGQTAEFMNNYGRKGRLIGVEGRVEINQFTGNDGVKRKAIDVICDNIELLDKPSDTLPEQTPSKPSVVTPEEEEDDDEDPFS